MVFGNDMPCLAAVLVLAQHDPQDVDAAVIDSVMQEVNERLPDYARVCDFIIADAPFSLATGELSASGSPCRAVIEQHYLRQVDNQPEVQNEQLL